LIKLASGFEAFTQVRAHNLPTFADTVPFNNIQGTTPKPPSGEAAVKKVQVPQKHVMPHHHM
jgi:hypothetical protein